MSIDSQKAQIGRINRRLARFGTYGQKLHKSRSWREESNLGEFYIQDIATGAVMDHHVDLDSLEAELTPPPRESLEARNEGLTFRLVERFNAGVYPEPHEFTDAEIECIAGWSGNDEKGTFGYLDGHPNSNPEHKSTDDKIVDEYSLYVTAGENTWTKFAAILTAKKQAWAAKHPADANLKLGEDMLEAAVEHCAIAGMSTESIKDKVVQFCDLICP